MSMQPEEILWAVLSLIGVRVPILIALSVGLVWAWASPRGAVRTVALAGLGVLLAGTAFGMVATLLPLWLVSANQFEALAGIGDALGIVHFAMSLMEALGVVLLVWALTRALRSIPALPQTADRGTTAEPGNAVD